MNSNVTEHAVLCNGYPAAARLSFVIMQQPGVGGYAALEIFFHGCPVPENLPILSGELLSRARVHSRLPPEPGAPARQNPQSSWFGSPIRVSAPDRPPNPWSHCGAMAPRIFCCFSKPQSNSRQVLRLAPFGVMKNRSHGSATARTAMFSCAGSRSSVLPWACSAIISRVMFHVSISFTRYALSSGSSNASLAQQRRS